MATFEDQLQVSGTNLRESVDWFGSEVKDLRERSKVTTQPEMGKMYLFAYDAKTKETLPFFDMFPLSIPIIFYNDGFLGLNLHYLPQLARLNLLNSLMSVVNSTRYTDNSKLNITYDILKQSTTHFPGYKNCVKRYLYAYIRSSFAGIEAEDWNKVVMLPLQQWSINTNAKYSQDPPY